MPEPGMRARMAAAVASIREYMEAARPDVIVAFLDDHFENHYRNLMPTFSIGVAPKHAGPADYWLEALKIDRKEDIPCDEAMAEFILGRLDARCRHPLQIGMHLLQEIGECRMVAPLPGVEQGSDRASDGQFA